jgi:archaellum component FlaC
MRTILTLSIIFLLEINSYSQSNSPSIPNLISSEESDNFSKKELRTYLESYKKELDTYQSELSKFNSEQNSKINELSKFNSEQNSKINELSKFNSEQNSKINELRGRLIVVESNLNESRSELNRLQKELDLLRPELKLLTDSLNSIHNNYPEVRNFITSVFQSLTTEDGDYGFEGTFIDSSIFFSMIETIEFIPEKVKTCYRQDFDKGQVYLDLEDILFIKHTNISKWEGQDIMNEKREWVDTRWIEIKSPHRYSVYVITGVGTYEGPYVSFVELIEIQDINGELKITSWEEIDVVEHEKRHWYYEVNNPYDYKEYLEQINR